MPPTVTIEDDGSIRIKLALPADRDVCDHAFFLGKALQVYQTRNSGQRRGVWRRSGIKGQVVHVFAKAERAFQAAFGKQEIPEDDHFYDLINYSTFALRISNPGTVDDIQPDPMNGEWPW